MDKRIIKSKEKIKQTYIQLLFDMNPDDIHVNYLCKLANINRTTFYDRYGYLDALIDEIIYEELIKVMFNGIFGEDIIKHIKNVEKNNVKKYIERFLNNKILMRFCMAENKEKYVGKIMRLQMDIGLNSLNGVPYYQSLFYCIGSLSILIEWLNDSKGYSIDEIVNIIYSYSLIIIKNNINEI